jgi:hypothetical protein
MWWVDIDEEREIHLLGKARIVGATRHRLQVLQSFTPRAFSEVAHHVGLDVDGVNGSLGVHVREAHGEVPGAGADVGDKRVAAKIEGADHFVRLLPGVSLRVVEDVRPLFGVAETMAMRVRRLRGRDRTKRGGGHKKQDSNHGMIIHMNIDWVNFTPWASAAGGILIGIAAAMLVLLNGRVAGISGMVSGLLMPRRRETGWRLAFLVGLLAAPLVMAFYPIAPTIDAGFGVLVAAGLLVGIGTSYGSGCTSGHGVCGLSRLSPRSLVATLTFMGAGILTVLLVRHFL